MRFFTPELFARTNSPDEDEADRASQEWERAITRARRHYRKVRPQLSESLRDFCEHYCLHDADILGPARLALPSTPWGGKDVIIVVQNENTLFAEHLHTLMFLRYAVTENPTVEIPLPDPVFHEGQPIWLYDEIDLVEPGIFSHEILLNNGRVVKLRFREFQLHVADLIAPYQTLNLTMAGQQKVASA